MQALAEGTFPSLLSVKSSEEIGKTKGAFNQLLERMKAAAEFATTLGQGNLRMTYSERFSKDILAQSMIRMQEQLESSNEKQAVINWTNTGTAQLNEILKNDSAADVASIGDQIIKTLVRYMKMNQGALYLLQKDGENAFLKRISTYAYEKKRFIDQKIEIGEGLVGQCYLDATPIIMTEVPKSYIRITSGLGETVPGFIIMIPLIVQGKVMGIMEMASLKTLNDFEVEFLKIISENIASLLANRKSATETLILLNEARDQAQRVATKEKEIQQKSEEMLVIQERMQRDKEELEKEVLLLKQRLSRQVSLIPLALPII